ncbi:MAG TPA: DNA repair protein RadC [Bacteroidota bacterium]|nr:DNA repair protein RadC [Bacteroidota bacterium]
MTEETRERVLEPSHYHTKIKDWPAAERPREKLLNKGADSLTEAELLALLIGSGTGKVTALDLAKTLLVEHQTLRGLAALSAADLRKFRGIGEARAVCIAAAFELSRRLQSSSPDEQPIIHAPGDVARLFIPKLRDLQQEVFVVVLLNSANRITREVTITRGLLNSSLTHPREVFRAAIVEHAASVILIHNHPSGNPEPSSEDLSITRQLVEASKVIGIPVHDHLIIAGGVFTSLAERGYMT